MLITGFRHKGDENCILLGHYTAASSGNSLLTSWDDQSVPSSRFYTLNPEDLMLEDGTDRLSQNIRITTTRCIKT